MDLLISVMVITAAGLAGSFELTDSRFKPDLKTCSDCINANPNNVWCFQTIPQAEMAYDFPRCQLGPYPITIQGNCRNHVEASTEKMLIRKNKSVRSKRPISPQKLDLELRKGASATIPFQVFSEKESVTVKFRYPRAVEVTVRSNCPGFTWTNRTAKCTGLPDRTVRFMVTVKLRRCLKKPRKIRATVRMNSNKKKSMKIFLKSRCKCECEKDSSPNSRHCNGRGSLTCGRCICNPGYHGTRCECDAAVVGGEEETIQQCKGLNKSTCLSRGLCVCGVCKCDPLLSGGEEFFGRYCETARNRCDRGPCPFYDGQPCGGDRGVCRCGKCQCMEGYNGTACEHHASTDNCISFSGDLCNNKGRCVHNRCQCDGLYMGPTCEECPTCMGWCSRLKSCVQCFAFRTGPIRFENCLRECDVLENAEIVEKVDMSDPTLRMCRYRDEDECVFQFGYSKQGVNRMKIRIQRTRDCPRQ